MRKPSSCNEQVLVAHSTQQCYERELWLCAEAGGITGMNGCAFALTIALLLVDHTSRAHLEASAHVEGECVRDMDVMSVFF